ILLGGRCRDCKKKISIRYPMVEALTGLISVVVYLKFGLTWQAGVYFIFCAALIVLALIDVDHRILPDTITLNGLWIGLALSLVLFQQSAFAGMLLRFAGINVTDERLLSFISSLIGAIVGGGLLWGVAEAYLRLRGVEGMGFGDVKMMAMVGAFLGAPLAL